MREYKRSELDHVRSLLKASLGPLWRTSDFSDDELECIIDWAEESGFSLEDTVSDHAKAIILVSTHLRSGMLQ
jgi:hypothetical protein